MHKQTIINIRSTTLLSILSHRTVWAHDPIFGAGPHMLFKDGIEASLELESGQAGSEKERAVALELNYGITGDQAIGIDGFFAAYLLLPIHIGLGL